MRLPTSTLLERVGIINYHRESELLKDNFVDITLRNAIRLRFSIQAGCGAADIGMMLNAKREAELLNVPTLRVLREFAHLDKEGLGKYVKLNLASLTSGYDGMPTDVFVPIHLCSHPAIASIYDLEKYIKSYGWYKETR